MALGLTNNGGAGATRTGMEWQQDPNESTMSKNKKKKGGNSGICFPCHGKGEKGPNRTQ